MASKEHVKQYLAYWFQLGKSVVIQSGHEAIAPAKVYQGNRYSDEFEVCWQRIQANNAGDCYLEGTHQTIAELLSSNWIITSCARCSMPVPMLDLGPQPQDGSVCPCFDLPGWPDSELPQPRSAVDSQQTLQGIQGRLIQASQKKK